MCSAVFGQALIYLCAVTVCYLTLQSSIYDHYSCVCVIGLMTVVTDQNHDNHGTQRGTAFFVDFLHVN